MDSDLTGTEYDTVSGLPVGPDATGGADIAAPLTSPVQAGNLPDGAALHLLLALCCDVHS